MMKKQVVKVDIGTFLMIADTIELALEAIKNGEQMVGMDPMVVLSNQAFLIKQYVKNS